MKIKPSCSIYKYINSTFMLSNILQVLPNGKKIKKTNDKTMWYFSPLIIKSIDFIPLTALKIAYLPFLRSRMILVV